MPDVHLDIRLRPVRIALLVRPTDRRSILKFMRASVCVWGGIYNPIIPVMKMYPSEWRLEAHERYKAVDIAGNYAKFFQPDVYVEAQPGLLDEAGLGLVRDIHAFRDRVIDLASFVAPGQGKDWVEASFGLDIINVFGDLYKSSYQFQMREETAAYLVRPCTYDGVVETVFGSYPSEAPAQYITNNYMAAFKAKEVEATPDTWIKVFKDHSVVPLYITQHGLQKKSVLVSSYSYFYLRPTQVDRSD